ncbi:MAG: putative metallopeptidase [Candidatus Bathyarchaeia archaeon]
MVIRYYRAKDIESNVSEIVHAIGLEHIDLSRVVILRSQGSRAANTIARIYGLPRVWQFSLGIEPHYVLELISENFDILKQEEKEKVLIHELLHIPTSFGGGFKHHRNWVNEKRVQYLHSIFKKRKSMS